MAKLLDNIKSPADLKTLTLSQLQELADEIRAELVKTVSATGGHLASSLGVVELTIALHRVFNSPKDKIIWDVGHQSYPHKLLTGRREAFATIRQYKGLCGFASREESPHDHFGSGHASTSVSAALGMALARDMAGEDYQVVAVIGDGALTGGMAFEALNHAGHLGTRIIVVLNDNGMSISPSTGALSRWLTRIRFTPRIQHAKQDAKRVVSRLPVSDSIRLFGRRFKTSVKGLVVPVFWEELGLDYFGPFDGHDIYQLETALSLVRDNCRGPILMHVVTQKGRGYPPAEQDAVSYHGVAPETDEPSKAPSYSKIFSQTMLRLLKENLKVVAISAAMLEGTGLSAAKQEFPTRVFDVGICEQHAVTLAAGLACQGYIPVVAVYSTFLQRAYDQLIHDVCIQKLHVVFAIDRAGIVGDDGKTHQGTFDISYLCAIPEMVVAAPRDENELQHLLYTAIQANRPMAVRYPRGSGQGVSLEKEWRLLSIGKGEVLREGSDLAIIALGNTVYPAMEVALKLSQQDIQCRVIDARFAKPLDRELLLAAASQTKRVVTVEENVLAGGFGSGMLQLLSEARLSEVRTLCLGLPDEFVEHGPQSLLRANYDLDASGIERRIKLAFPELLERPLKIGRKR